MVKKTTGHYVPALGHGFLTSLYDPVVALTTRERTFKSQLFRQAEIPDGADVLDLGSGTGTLAIWVAKKRPNARVVGLDADPKVVSIAERKAAAANVKLRFDVGLCFELPYPDASFDRVLSSLLFHHLTRSDKRRTILEIHRVLKPGGQLHVADWGRPSSVLMKMLFYPIQILDGFDNTRDNVQGLLPGLFEEGGLESVSLRKELRTIFGTLALYSANKAD